VLLGNGDGTFQAPAFLTAGDVPVSVAAADLNDDDFTDLAIANRDSNDVSVMLGNGNGTFQAPDFYLVGIAPVSIAVSQFFSQIDDAPGPPPATPDLFPDIVTANRGSNNVSVILGNGDGSFRAARHFATGNAPVSMVVSNLNGDSRNFGPPANRVVVQVPDIVTANRDSYNATVLLGVAIPATPEPNVDFRDAAGVSVTDKESDFFKVKQFCTPADKNDEGIPDRSIYLTCYEAKRALPVRPQVITNDQFGELKLDVRKQRTQLCLRSELIWVDDSKPTPTPTASPVPTPEPDPEWPSYQYELFRVKRSRGADRFDKREVTIDDLFLNESVQLKKPDRLGVPTGTDGKGIQNSYHHLNCYSVKAPRFKLRYVQVTNDFGTLDLTVRRPNMLCTPSLKEVVPEDQ